MVGFRGTVESFHAESTIKLPLKSNGSDDKDANAFIPFDKLVSQVPELSNGSRFYLNPFYFSGELQTIGFSLADHSKVYHVYYGRRVLTMDDGATLSADYVLPKPDSDEEFNKLMEKNHREGWPKQHPRTRFLVDEELDNFKSTDTKPILVIHHGLGGGSHEAYCRAMAEGVYNKGFDVVVLHARGCGRSLITTPELFSGFSTDEIRFFLKQLRADYPNRPFYGVGFSFGASLLSTYLGEEGENSEYTACVALSNPWSLVDSCYRLGFCFWPRVLFLKPITQTLVRLVKSNQKELLKNELITEEKINAHYTSPHHFDSVFTAPLNGFNSALEYYRGASSINKIFKIRTPLLVINSYDDPVVGINSIPTYEAEINPSIVCLRTDLGGHIAYVRPDGSLWAIDKIAEFFEAFQNTVDTSQKIKSDFKHKISRYHDRLTH